MNLRLYDKMLAYRGNVILFPFVMIFDFFDKKYSF